MAPEKPCPWHAETFELGRLKDVYCEVGPDGHPGSHVGNRSRGEYLTQLRAWRVAQNQIRKESNASGY